MQNVKIVITAVVDFTVDTEPTHEHCVTLENAAGNIAKQALEARYGAERVEVWAEVES